MSVITVENLRYRYPHAKELALDGLDFSVEKGEFIGIIGENGAGKSTLSQALMGLVPQFYKGAYGGTVMVDGIEAGKTPVAQLCGHVGLVFQYPEYQLFEADVLSDVCFGPKNLGLPEEEVKARSLEALHQVGLKEKHYNKSPFDLSGGQKRRVAIAGILAMHPEVLILDEPTAGLDPKGRDDILDQIAKLHKERGITVILVSHSMEDVAKYVDRIIVMDHGCMKFDGEPKKVFEHYKELESIGLSAPQVTYVMQTLKEKGFDVDVHAITIEEAKQSILHAFGMEDRRVNHD